jgi:hypothetical protein
MLPVFIACCDYVASVVASIASFPTSYTNIDINHLKNLTASTSTPG